MSEHAYKLTYLEGRGRAEICRLIFAAAGQKYDDVRIPWEKFSEFKLTTPFGQVPILEIDGSTVLCQSIAIALYLANEFKLSGKTALDKARAHMIIECYEDIVDAEEPYWLEKDDAKKAEIKKTFKEEKLPKHLASLEKLLKQNNGGDGFFVGDSLTWADIGLISLADWLKILEADGQLADYEKLNALMKRVSSIPNIAQWLLKRPQTEW